MMKQTATAPPSPPISVLRKSGSSRCLQINNDNKVDDGKPFITTSLSSESTRSITMINNETLPSFGTERYYMLSEIQLKAHSIQYLSDLVPDAYFGESDDEKTQDMSISSHSWSPDHEELSSMQQHHLTLNDTRTQASPTRNRNTHHHELQGLQSDQMLDKKLSLPPYVILYLLWRPDCTYYDDPSSYVENVINPSVHHLIHLYEGNEENNSINQQQEPFIYIVVDRVIHTSTMDQIEEEEEGETGLNNEDTLRYELRNQVQMDIAASLIRKVSIDPQLKLRSLIKGITVGLSDSIRAAPGLEICMESILVGDSERRRFAAKTKKREDLQQYNKANWTMDQPNRSSIGLITEYPDDLTGLDPQQETDAAQVDLHLHTRCSGAWEGNGNIMNFALLSQQLWRKYWKDNCLNSKNKKHDDKDDDFLLLMYSIIMGTNGKKRNRRTGRKKKVSGRYDDDDDGEALQTRYLPSKLEQQNAEWAANVMIIVVVMIIGYFNRNILYDWINVMILHIDNFIGKQDL